MSAPVSESILLDFDGWLGRQDVETRSGIESQLAIAEDRDVEKRNLAARVAVMESTGLDAGTVNDRWDAVRGGLSEQRGGEWLAVKDDDAAFHAQLVKDATQRRDERHLLAGGDDDRAPDFAASWENSLIRRARESAFAGNSHGAALIEWENANRGKPGFDEARMSDYAELAAREHADLAATIERVKPRAMEALETMKASREGGDETSSPAALFRGMSPQEKDVAFRLMSDGAKGKSDKGRGQAFFEAMGRGFENLMAGGGSALFRSRLLRSEFKAGDAVSESGALAQVTLDASREAVARMGPNMGGVTRATRKLTAEEAAQWNQQIDEAREDLDTAERLRKFSQDEVDPTRVGGLVFQKIVLPVADSTAIMASMAIPGAWAPAIELAASSYRNDEYARLRSEGMDAREADSLAAVTGFAQAGLDRLQFGILRGLGSKVLPRTSATLERFALGGHWAARAGVNIAVTTVAETAIELTQDHLIPALVQDNLASDPTFDVRWGEVWREALQAAPETMAGMLLLSGLGAAVQTRSQSIAARELGASAAAMRLRGYSFEQIGEIQSASVEDRSELLARYLPVKAPEGKERDALIADATQRAASEAAAFEARHEAETIATAEAADYAIRVSRRGSRWWVDFEDKSMQVDTAEAARRIRDDLSQAATQREAEALVSIIEDWHGKAGDAQRETTLTGATVEVDAGGVKRERGGEVEAVKMDAATLEELHREMAMFGAATGDGMAVAINGSNVVEWKERVGDGARQLIQRLEINQSESAVLTFLHESVEADWRAGVKRGALTRDETQRAIATLARAFNVEASRDAEERGLRERVQKIARGEASETELRETFSELVVADILGKRERAGSVSAALNEAINAATDAGEIRALGKVRSFLRAVRQYFRALFGTVAALKKSRREGKAADWDALVAKVAGSDEQQKHDADLADEIGEYVEPTAEEKEAGVAFRLAAGKRVEVISKRIDAALSRDPERRRILGRRANEKLQALQFNWETERQTATGVTIRPLVEERSKRELDKEQAVRQALRAEELEAQGMAALDDKTLLALDAGAQKFTDGFLTSSLLNEAGRLMSKTDAAKRGLDNAQEYDDVPWLPAQMWGGTLRPDEAAQILADMGVLPDGYPQTLWDALAKEMASIASANAQFAAARKAVMEVERQARNQAREEAAEWRRAQDEMQAKDWSPRARLVRDLRTLDAILSVLPAEIRGKVGGFVKLAKLGSDGARLAEIERRITKMGGLLEKHLQKENVEALDRLIEKAQPDGGPGERAGGKITVAGHRVFKAIEAVRGLSKNEVEAQRAALWSQIEAAAEKGESTLDLEEQAQILDLFGDFAGKSAADGDAAVRFAEAVYVTGRNAWREIEAQRAEQIAALREEIIAAAGKLGGSLANRQDRKAEATKVAAMLENGSLDLLSFVQVLENLLGPGHALVKRWNRAARVATAQKTDAILAANARFEDAAMSAMGGASRLEMSRRLWTMATEQTVEVPKREGVAHQTITVPRAKVEQLRDGIVKPETFDLSPDEADALIAQLDDPDSARRSNLEIERVNPGTLVPAKLTEGQAMSLTMLARQVQYRENLTRHGFTQDVLDAAEAGLGEDAKRIRDWLLRDYAANYEPLARLFREMFGVDLPKIANYSPASFIHEGKEREVDPFGGGLLPEGGFRAGFLKERKAHLAEPELHNALAVWQGHVAMTEHWQAFAPFVRELRGVLGNRDVKKAIKGAKGEEMAGALQRWIESFENNGLQARTLGRTLDGIFREVSRRKAVLTLAWKLSTAAKNLVLPALNSIARVPAREWTRSFARVLRGQVDVRAIYESPMIQRRIESGFSPEVRVAMASLFNGKPAAWRRAIVAGMEIHAHADALSSALGTAIAYDASYRAGIEAGLAEDAAREQALVEAEDNLGRTAQPVEMMDRSLLELGMSPLERAGFMFATESRKSAAFVIAAAQQVRAGRMTKGEAARVMFSMWFAAGIGSAIITAAIRDARDDDDDSWMDWEHWNPVDLATQTLLGPLGGIPMINTLGGELLGFGSGGPFGAVGRGKGALTSLFDGDKAEPVEKTVKRVNAVVQSAGMLTTRAEAIAVAGNIFEQAFNLADNLGDTDAEEMKKRKAAAARARREAREARDE